MADTHSPVPVPTVPRPDVDIYADIERLIERGYRPLFHDNDYYDFEVHSGVVRIYGNISTPQARQFFHDYARITEGVQRVDDSGLHDDETLRLTLGQMVPVGTFLTVTYGVVIVTGQPVEPVSVPDLTARLEAVPGVRKVAVRFVSVPQ